MLATTRNTLVLNSNWCAVGVAPIHKAINLLFTNYDDGEPKARVITPPPKGSYEVWDWGQWSEFVPKEDEDAIAGASRRYLTPEVILLSRYDSMPIRKIHFCRRELWKRDNFTCQYCGVRPPDDECTIDHVVPKSLGGDTSWTNCVLACYRCNSQKADRKPEDARKPHDKSKSRRWRGPSPMKLMKTPAKPEYSIIRSRIKIPETWRHWLDRMYWEIPLESDMIEESDFEV
jgi:5-methylcytosine-specific restriction endonuclease McrA